MSEFFGGEGVDSRSSNILQEQIQQQQQQFHWSHSVMDSSRVSTCLISMLLIVYGSFRSLNMEQEARERKEKQKSESMTNLLTGETIEPQESSEYFFFLYFSEFFMKSGSLLWVIHHSTF